MAGAHNHSKAGTTQAGERGVVSYLASDCSCHQPYPPKPQSLPIMRPYQGRNFRRRQYTSSLSEATKTKACKLIHDRPGLTARQIAVRVGADKREMSRFLYSEGMQSRSIIVRNWRWYPSGYVQGTLWGQPASDTPSGTEALVAPGHCAALGRMTKRDAIEAIGHMDEQTINEAVREPQFMELVLPVQEELLQQQELRQPNRPQVPVSPEGGQWLLRALVIGLAAYGAVVVLSKVVAALSR